MWLLKNRWLSGHFVGVWCKGRSGRQGEWDMTMLSYMVNEPTMISKNSPTCPKPTLQPDKSYRIFSWYMISISGGDMKDEHMQCIF